MITYKNISFSAKTFYGIKFEPGEVKSVPGYITCSSMIRVFDDTTKQQPKSPTSRTSVFTSNRGRKKRSNESKNDSVAETEEIKIEILEETTDGNPS
jgi:hypothetical protein